MRKSVLTPLIVVVVLIVLAFIGGRFLYYGYGANAAYNPPKRELKPVQFDEVALSARQEIVDNPNVSEGVVVFDFNHDNALFIEELNTLYSKIVSRGFSYELVTPQTAEEEGQSLIDRLRYAKALVLPLPRVDYTPEEVAAIKNFVDKGGQVLIMGDPTRTVVVEAINSIAGSFGITYANDYLYSLENNDNNYRNVVYTNFNESPVTKGLGDGDKIIFYGGNSISAPGYEVVLGDETTFSSISDSSRTSAPVVLTTNDHVLAVGDMTFLAEPYSAAESNGKLINNIADFLTDVDRGFELGDFPYFFNGQVNVVFDDTLVFNSQFEDSVKLREYIEAAGRKVSFTDTIGEEGDVIFVGRFTDAGTVQDSLAAGNVAIHRTSTQSEREALLAGTEEEVTITLTDTSTDDADADFVEGRIQMSGVGELELGGSTLFYLHREADRNVLIILSDNPDTNADAFELLLDHEFTSCLAGPFVAVCQTEEPNKQESPSVRSSRIDKILVVSDDSGRSRADQQTGAVEFQNVLSVTYQVDTWFTSDGDQLDLETLQDYDAIIWTTGDYWDDSISSENAELLTEYIEGGGNLILSGASVAFDWDHTDFLADVVHAEYVGFAPQTDIELTLQDHPIARGFAEGQVITFTNTPSGEPIEPDVVSHAPGARVIFQRGPGSSESGAASVIAYEDDRSKIAYYAFPFYLLDPTAQAPLVSNTIDWFTRKPLDRAGGSEQEPFIDDGEEEEEAPPEGEEGEDTGEEGTGDEGTGDENGDEGEDTGDEGEDTGDEGEGTGDEGEENGDEGTGDENGTEDDGSGG
jgi:hypothetical protein